MCFEALIYSDHQGKGYDPCLAESWDIAPDGMSWTFYLRKGVVWHNGDPFDADDVAYTIQRCIDNRDTLAFTSQYIPDLESVEKIDQYTVKMNFSKPNPMAGAGIVFLFIIPQKAHQELGDDLFNLQYCYGTGPWKMKEWVDGEYTHFVKNESYWNKANFDSYFDEVVVRYLGEPASAIAAHLSDNVDTYINTGGIAQDLLPLYKGTEDKIELVTIDTNSTTWLGLSFKEGSIWHDEKTRKAFDLAIDRQLIIDNILNGSATVPTGYFHNSIMGFDASLGQPAYDPDLAKQLLAESSYNGESFSLMTGPATSESEAIFLTIADMANKVGFNMSIEFVDMSVFTPRQNSGDYDMFTVTTATADGIPQRQLNRIPNNFDKADYVNEELNEYIRLFNTELNFADRYEAARKAQAMIYENKAPHISMFHRALTRAINYGIVGIDLYPDGMVNYCYVDYDPSKLP
jgi:peptide/nickel transport system substrate-binding protein